MNDPAPGSDGPYFNAQHIPHTPRLRQASHYINNAAGWSPALHVNVWLLELYRSGDVDLRIPPIGRRTMRARVGLLIPPGGTYYERPRSQGRKPTSTFILFDAGNTALPPPFLGAKSSPFWIEDPHGTLQMLLDRIVAAVHGKGWMTLSAAATFYQVLTLLATAKRRGRTLTIGGDEDVTPQFVVSANDFMRKRLGESLAISDIAAEVGLSASGFSHAYRRSTGRSPMMVLRALRVEAAKQHLIRGRLKLDAIARLTGFADAFHLSRVFKRVLGVSPRAFLKTHAAAHA